MRNTCSVDGCDRRHKSRQLCTGHYERWRLRGVVGGSLLEHGKPIAFLEQLLSERRNEPDCILWPYAKTPAGYGTIGGSRSKIGGTQYVHRIVCERVHGLPPTPKHEAAHLCGRGHEGCVNPKHLAWKTRKENHADTLIHGTDNRGEKHYASLLCDDDIRNIRNLYSGGGLTYADVAALFGVSAATVGCIVRRENWGHVA
jgi:hypothetical protein